MKNIIITTLSAVFLLVSCGSEKHADYYVIDGFAQGSTYHFVFETVDTTGIHYSIDSLLLAVDNSLSLYCPNSLINRLNRNETDSLDSYIEYCINTSRGMSDLSGGSYDITIKPVVQAWGFVAEQGVDDPNIDSLLQFVGYKKISIENGRLIKTNPNTQIDLSSIAQGYTADLLAKMMENRGVKNYLVEIGGEIFCRGVNAKAEQWVVGIDKPFEGNFTPGVEMQVKLHITGKGLATSGNYRKFHTDSNGRKIVHIIDARTGISQISNLLSATVIAENSAIADAYGTVMMILGLERSKQLLTDHPEIMGYLIYTDQAGEYQTYSSPELEQYIVK